jgi:hypothetical protein
MGRLEKSLSYLTWPQLAGAVLDVFTENQRREGPAAYKASADIWCLDETLREDIHQRACRFWCARTKLDRTYFPLSVDAVARLYFRFRKRNHDEVCGFKDEIAKANGLIDHPDLFDDATDA